MVFCQTEKYERACLQVDLEQKDCWLSLQQRQVYSGSAENCNLGLDTRVSPTCKSLHSKSRRERELFYGGDKEVGRIQSTESEHFHWLSPCQEGRGGFPPPVGLCYEVAIMVNKRVHNEYLDAISKTTE